MTNLFLALKCFCASTIENGARADVLRLWLSFTNRFTDLSSDDELAFYSLESDVRKLGISIAQSRKSRTAKFTMASIDAEKIPARYRNWLYSTVTTRSAPGIRCEVVADGTPDVWRALLRGE
jgi:hypothetical protein